MAQANASIEAGDTGQTEGTTMMPKLYTNEREWENAAEWGLELVDENKDDIDFYPLTSELKTLDDVLRMAIRFGGPIRDIGTHADAILADGMPGYWIQTERLQFNALPMIDTPVDAD